MNLEGPSLLFLLAASAVAGTSGTVRADAKPMHQNESDVMDALRASVEQHLSALGVVVRDPRTKSPLGIQTAQWANFPNFPNYFRNCYQGYWRNC